MLVAFGSKNKRMGEGQRGFPNGTRLASLKVVTAAGTAGDGVATTASIIVQPLIMAWAGRNWAGIRIRTTVALSTATTITIAMVTSVAPVTVIETTTATASTAATDMTPTRVPVRTHPAATEGTRTVASSDLTASPKKEAEVTANTPYAPTEMMPTGNARGKGIRLPGGGTGMCS